MKRITALILSLVMVLSLCACGVEPDSTGEMFTDPTEVTTPDGQMVYSAEPFIEYPQTGEYKETALLTNVPGQGVPLLLDMREDGTIDYIFGSTDRAFNMQSFVDNGVKYYTISPDGTARLHPENWITELDAYLAPVEEACNIKNGKWIFQFVADEGTVLILAHYGPNLYTVNTILHTALFKLRGDQLTLVPIDWEVEVGGKVYDFATSYLELGYANGYVFFEREPRIPDTPGERDDRVVYATYRLDGSLVHGIAVDEEERYGTWTGEHYTGIVEKIDSEGKISIVPYEAPTKPPYTDNDSLYKLGKYPALGYAYYGSNCIAYGAGEDFCCWFDEGGQTVLVRYDYNPEGAIEPEIVTVWSLEPIELIETAVAEWNHAHASPIFRYETVREELEGTNLTEEDILTRLKLELANGKGPDVLIMDGLDVDTMMDFLTPLDRVNTEGVYESIVDRFTVDGELMAISARMIPYLLGRAAENTQQMESLTQFADMVTSSGPPINVRDVGDWEPTGGAVYYIKNYNQLFRLWYPAWADAIWAGGKLNKDVFEEFLTQTDRLVEHYGLTEPWEEVVVGKPTNPEFLDTAFDPVVDETDFYYLYRQLPYTLAATEYVGLDTYWWGERPRQKPSEPFCHYLEAIPGPDGSGAMIPTVIAGVRAGGNEEAGQEFVQILLSQELQLGSAYRGSDNGGGYPVKWSATEILLARKAVEYNRESGLQNDFEATLGSLRAVVIDKTLFEMALVAAQSCYRSEDPLTPEEAADLLEETGRIYLAEKRQ